MGLKLGETDSDCSAERTLVSLGTNQFQGRWYDGERYLGKGNHFYIISSNFYLSRNAMLDLGLMVSLTYRDV